MRSITPTPGDDRHALPRTGILSIRVINAEGLAVPQGASLSAAVQAALKSQQAQEWRLLLTQRRLLVNMILPRFGGRL